MEESSVDTLMQMAQRLEDAAASLETAAARVLEQHITLAAKAELAAEDGNTIIATVDSEAEEQRMAEVERRLQEAEARLEAFSMNAAAEGGRKTAAAGVPTMLAKQEGNGVAFAAGAVDGALATLSIEQRIAVKAELMRAGLLG